MFKVYLQTQGNKPVDFWRLNTDKPNPSLSGVEFVNGICPNPELMELTKTAIQETWAVIPIGLFTALTAAWNDCACFVSRVVTIKPEKADPAAELQAKWQGRSLVSVKGDNEILGAQGYENIAPATLSFDWDLD